MNNRAARMRPTVRRLLVFLSLLAVHVMRQSPKTKLMATEPHTARVGVWHKHEMSNTLVLLSI